MGYKLNLCIWPRLFNKEAATYNRGRLKDSDGLRQMTHVHRKEAPIGGTFQWRNLPMPCVPSPQSEYKNGPTNIPKIEPKNVWGVQIHIAFNADSEVAIGLGGL